MCAQACAPGVSGACLQAGDDWCWQRHLQALLDLLGEAHARTGVGCQVDKRQLLLQRVLSGRPEHGVLLRPKRAAVVCDVI